MRQSTRVPGRVHCKPWCNNHQEFLGESWCQALRSDPDGYGDVLMDTDLAGNPLVYLWRLNDRDLTSAQARKLGQALIDLANASSAA